MEQSSGIISSFLVEERHYLVIRLWLRVNDESDVIALLEASRHESVPRTFRGRPHFTMACNPILMAALVVVLSTQDTQLSACASLFEVDPAHIKEWIHTWSSVAKLLENDGHIDAA
ncbi:hypothetical protein [Verrucomicrobium spinosum]|uniref:hypothetical protein n=1 Tax=Verrucomicrobium spinosum TaxID=2736 RepID=UPI0001745024|nr:hypothetical protein [Verrucomicrobium spinosum]